MRRSATVRPRMRARLQTAQPWHPAHVGRGQRPGTRAVLSSADPRPLSAVALAEAGRPQQVVGASLASFFPAFRREFSTIGGRKLASCAPKKPLFDPLSGGKTAFSIAPEGVERENVKIGKTVLCSFVDFFPVLFRTSGFFSILFARAAPAYRRSSMRPPSFPQSPGSAEFDAS